MSESAGFAAARSRSPYRDPESGTWVLSRYADVLAAFRDPRLWPVDAGGEFDAKRRDGRGVLLERRAVLDALSATQLDEWQREMSARAGEMLGTLPTNRPVELLREFAKPWCMSIALMVTGANPNDQERLYELGDRVFARGGAPDDSPLRTRAAEAIDELESYFSSSALPMAESTFMGISQTLPRLLTNGWLALITHPEQLARLREEPDLLTRAVEELLRYAGIIPDLYRVASADVDLGTVQIAAGERATLMVVSANRDPERFPEPDRLDLTRRGSNQLALGIGRSSCAGARLIRMVQGVALRTMLAQFDHMTVTDSVHWRTGSGFCWPTAVHVALRRGTTRDD